MVRRGTHRILHHLVFHHTHLFICIVVAKMIIVWYPSCLWGPVALCLLFVPIVLMGGGWVLFVVVYLSGLWRPS